MAAIVATMSGARTALGQFVPPFDVNVASNIPSPVLVTDAIGSGPVNIFGDFSPLPAQNSFQFLSSVSASGSAYNLGDPSQYLGPPGTPGVQAAGVALSGPNVTPVPALFVPPAALLPAGFALAAPPPLSPPGTPVVTPMWIADANPTTADVLITATGDVSVPQGSYLARIAAEGIAYFPGPGGSMEVSLNFPSGPGVSTGTLFNPSGAGPGVLPISIATTGAVTNLFPGATVSLGLETLITGSGAAIFPGSVSLTVLGTGSGVRPSDDPIATPVLPDPKPFITDTLPPRETGEYVGLPGIGHLVAPGVVLTDVAHSAFSDALAPPEAGDPTQVHVFDSTVSGFANGFFFEAPAQTTVEVSFFGEVSDTRFFLTEMTELSIVGGTLPPGLMIREDPNRPSMGGTTITGSPGGAFSIASYFDIFLETSLDGGQSFIPSTGSINVHLVNTAVAEPSSFVLFTIALAGCLAGTRRGRRHPSLGGNRTALLT